jgi:nucleosome assembly protein 1-like 1
MTEQETPAASADAGSEHPTFEEKVAAEMETAKDMKIGDLKLKLMAMGILTHSFCEKSEFVRAYADATVKKAEQAAVVVAEDDGDDEDAAENEVDDEDEDQDPMAELPGYVKQRVKKLTELNGEREKAMEGYLKERAALEAKYQTLCKPLYEKRSEIINGKMDDNITKENEGEDQPEEDDGERVAGVPQFWVCALGHMDVVAELITEQDVDCLEHLQDITCYDDDNGEGFTIKFHFGPNDYFENSVLTKRYEIPNLLLADEPILKNVEGCDIKWKSGRSLTCREVTKKQRGKGKNAGQIRSVKSQEQTDSFFNFFQPPKMPSLDMMDEEEADRLEQAFDQDYDIAQAFRSHVVPKAVLWFTGQVSRLGIRYFPRICSSLVIILTLCFSRRWKKRWTKRWQGWKVWHGQALMVQHQRDRRAAMKIQNANKARFNFLIATDLAD